MRGQLIGDTQQDHVRNYGSMENCQGSLLRSGRENPDLLAMVPEVNRTSLQTTPTGRPTMVGENQEDQPLATQTS